MKWKKWIRPALFTLGGALADWPITNGSGAQAAAVSSPQALWAPMLYMGLIGWLLSGLFRKERDKCNM